MQIATLAYVVVIATLSFAKPAHAYIDPGTGTLIVQSLIGGAAAAVTVGSVYLAKIRSFISRLIGREPSEGRSGPQE